MRDTPDRTGHRALLGAAVSFFLIGLVVLAWNIPLPLLAYSPGPSSDAADAIVVEDSETYPGEGELVLLTVVGQDINIFEALVAAVDPSVDVLARQAVRRPDESDEDYRRRNLQMMDQSTATAISVALSHLDLDDTESGVFITGYAADTPAGEVLEMGDRVRTLGESEISGVGDLAPALEGMAPGDVVEVGVERDGEDLVYRVELAAQEESPETPIIGIFVRQLPFWMDIESGVVGGPSAGLMYSLAIIDMLTPGSLTGGHIVAGTGTIDPEGAVGAIGGVRQKVVAAEAAGAEYMLVPAANYDDATSAPRQDLELVSVATIDEALAFLEDLGSL